MQHSSVRNILMKQKFEIEFLLERDWNSAFTIPTYDAHEKGHSDEVLNLDAMEKKFTA